MYKCSGSGGKVIVGCWHKDSLRTGYEEFYKANPQLCGECKETDFDFERGDFECSTSDYTSHWWSEQELKDILFDTFPGKPEELQISFKVIGVGIFAVCDISARANF